MHLHDTICAIATPPGQGGIGIVRISGKKAKDILKRIWDGHVSVEAFESHKMYFGRITNPSQPFPAPPGGEGGGAIDSVFAVWMQSPKTYTGEDVVEISCHGGMIILRKVLSACLEAGARIADPGEFTKRAFLNGKLDLVQAEAVADLIAATSDAASRAARQQLDGRLSQEINKIADEITSLCAFVEATIDFPEEDINFIADEGIAERLANNTDKIRSLAGTYAEGRMVRDGVKTAIIGKPNVGKSSLFNALVGQERAIVHHSAGTTRDLVTETVQIGGIAFHLTDGAGLREASHEVEKIGIEKASENIKQADIVIFVMDGSQVADDEDEAILEKLDLKQTIICMNKYDLQNPPIPPLKKGGVKPRAKQRCRNAALRRWGHAPLQGKGGFGKKDIVVSALRGDGIDELKKMLLEGVRGQRVGSGQESVVITSARHKQALEETVKEIENAGKATANGKSSEFIAHHLHLAHESLGRITGRVGAEEVLNEIFARFCIGK